MKKLTAFSLATVLLFSLVLGGCAPKAPAADDPAKSPAVADPAQEPAKDPAPAGDKVVLTMGSWRTDDVAQMENLLAAYSAVAPNVEIQFQPTNPPDYNATLRLQLEGGT
ncbi:MAG: hypothetical protein RRY97_10225, partial [Oscillibacter sp.]